MSKLCGLLHYYNGYLMAYAPDQFAAHAGRLEAKDMLHPGPYLRTFLVYPLFGFA